MNIAAASRARHTTLGLVFLFAAGCRSSHAKGESSASAAAAAATSAAPAAATATAATTVASVTSSAEADDGKSDPLIDLGGAKAPPPGANVHWVQNRAAGIKFIAPVGYKESKRGSFVAYGAPDKSALIAMTTFDKPNESTKKLGEVAQALGVSGVAWKTPKSARLGEGEFSSRIAGGTCDAGGPAHIAYATINPGKSTQILFVYFVRDDAPKERLAEVKRFLDTVDRL